MKRIVIIINKSWEADAVFAAILNDDFKKAVPDWKNNWEGIQLEYALQPFEIKQGIIQPRAVFSKEEYQIEIWCLNNVMPERPINNTDDYYYSRAIYKAVPFEIINNYNNYKAPILVVAFGTAGVPSDVTKNGGLVIGSNIFPFDSGKSTQELTYSPKQLGQIVTSSIAQDFFDQLILKTSSLAMRLFFETSTLTTPRSPSDSFQLIIDKSIVAISDMNTNNYKDFAESDKAAIKSFNNLKNQDNIAYSVETTHAIIRLESNCDNFVFISAVTDRLAYFDNEVTPKVHAQNFSAAFNGGVFLNWFIPFLFSFYIDEKILSGSNKIA